MRLQRRRRKNYQKNEKEVKLRRGKYEKMGGVHSEEEYKGTLNMEANR
jgi:hypothetical protein